MSRALPQRQRLTALAHEIGHLRTMSLIGTPGQIEMRAIKYAVFRIVPLKQLVKAIQIGCWTLYELAEHFDVDERFMRQALHIYGLSIYCTVTQPTEYLSAELEVNMGSARGMGTVIKAGNGWVAQINTPYGRKTNRAKSQREAREWLTQMRREMDKGTYIELSERPLYIWWKEWMDTYKRITTSDSSMRSFEQSINRIKRHAIEIWDCPLSKLTPPMIQRAITAIHNVGMTDRTCAITLTHIRDCLNRAVLDGLLKANPAKNIKPPRTHTAQQKRAMPLNDEEYEKLIAWCTAPLRINNDGSKDLNDLATRPIRDIILFIAQTGVRCGEAMAVRWTDIQGKMVTISKSIDTKGVESQTKTGNTRTVPLTPLVMAMLERRRFIGHEYVFSTRNGTPIGHTNILKHMRSRFGHTVHELRHTYITRAARAGVNPRVLQTITGHKNVSVLLQVYTHVSEEDKTMAMERMIGS